MKTRNPQPGLRALALVVAGVLVLSTSHLGGQSRPAQEVAGRTLANELALKITVPFTVAAMGDIITPQPLTSADPRYHELIKIVRDADVSAAR